MTKKYIGVGVNVSLLEKFSEDERFEGMVFYDGLDDAFIGIGWRFNVGPIAVYNRKKVIEILGEDMSQEDAEEHFDFNVIGGWVGDFTPMFVELQDDIEM